MSIGYTARGTGGFTDNTQSTGSLTVSVTVGATGSTLTFGSAYDGGDEILTATWNGISMTQRKKQGVAAGGGLFGEIWDLFNVTAGTHNLVITWDSSINGYPKTAYTTIAEITGCSTSPFDVAASASGSSTSPSSGATASIAQANELDYGIIATAGPQSDTAGTWSNGFTNGQRVGDSTGTVHSTCSEGYFITSSIATQTAAKTGITLRTWRALIATYKEASAPPVTVNLGAGSATTTGRAVATAMGGISVGLGSGSSTSTGRSVTDTLGGLTLTLGPGVATSTGFDLNSTGQRFYLNPTPQYGTTEPTAAIVQEAASIGIRSKGKPYFSLVTSDDTQQNLGPSDGENTWLLTFAINSPPAQLANPDELHPIVSYFVPGAGEHWALAVTPNGALAAREAGVVTVRTPPGVVPFNGTFHSLNFFRTGLSASDLRGITLDGTTIVEQYGTSARFSSAGARWFMFFNDWLGSTQCAMTIRYFEFDPEGTNPLRWMFNEGAGVTVKAEEYSFIDNAWEHQPSGSDYPGCNYDASAQWFDPRSQGKPLLRGSIPTASVQSAYTWDISTSYGGVKPGDTDYHKQTGNTPYIRTGPANPNYRRVTGDTTYKQT
jgi:hypothetical protein